MSEISLFEFENQQTENLFSCRNYILRNDRHEKTILENSAGEKMILHFLYKPADISVYKALTEISNPFLCRIYEISENEKGFAVYEEYCDGMTLAEYCGNNEMSEYDAVEIACQICKGLYALHSCGIVHRDIKPDNIIIRNDNTVKIIDYDISKIYKSDKLSDTQALGTVGFAAPEQYGFHQSDCRADLYSLSVLLNYLMTGEHPSVKMCDDKTIAKILKKCLAINPEDRYSSAEELYIAMKKMQRRLKR